MWLSQQFSRPAARRGAVSTGRVTIAGESPAVMLSAERRELRAALPAGLRWAPALGDEVLVLAADRLCEVFADKCHTVYRLGGDEFLVISQNTSEDDLVALLLQLKDVELAHADFRLSKGYSFVQMKEPGCFNTAFDNADKMLYADKNSKKQPASN